MMETTGIANNSDGGFRYRINQLSVAVVCVWMTLPYFRNKAGLYVLISFFGLWLITTDLKWLVSKWPKDIIFLVIFFGTFIPYIITGTLGFGLFGTKTLLVSVPEFFMGIFIIHYYLHYKNDYNSLGIIALVSLISVSIGSFQTYLGLETNPGAARALGGSIGEDTVLKALYEGLGIGGFGFVYGACFVFIATLYVMIKGGSTLSKMYKVLCGLACVVMFLMILKASFATAIILVVLGAVLTLVVKSRSSYVFVILLSAGLLLFIPQELVGEAFLKLAVIFSNNKILYTKFITYAAKYLTISSGSGVSIGRFDLVLFSLKTFLKHPLFGLYGPLGDAASATDTYVIGYHSGWLDMLGFYGLFTGIPLVLIIYYNIKKQFILFKNDRYMSLFFITSCLFVFLGVVNPLINVFEVGFAYFCIVPAMPFLGSAFIPNSARLNSSES